MAAAIRGQASGRFYKAFHAWSRLGSVSHAQRRCFVRTSSVYDAIDVQPRDTRNEQHAVRSPQSSDKQHGVQTEEQGHATDSKKSFQMHIPQSRFVRMQEHPTYLQRMRAELDATVEPVGDAKENGYRRLRITAPTSVTCNLVRRLLSRTKDDPQSLSDTYFISDKYLRPVNLKIMISPHRLDLLQDNGDELILRIQDTFSIQLDIAPEDEKNRTSGTRTLAIKGERRNVESAENFILSLEVGLQESQQPSQQSTERIKDMYKATMRSVPSSVAILTTRLSSSRTDVDSFRGMTVSSLTSVTLEPEPIISFSIRAPSRTLDCITQGQPFTIHFPQSHPQAAQIAHIFSKPHEDPSQPFRIIRDLDLASVQEHESSSGPVIGGRNISARFKCELLPGKSVEIGDHTVIFARVMNIWWYRRLDGRKKSIFLAYAQASYRGLAQKALEMPESKTLEPAKSNESAPVVPEISTPQPPQPKEPPQEPQVSDQSTSAEPVSRDTSTGLSDAYWQMALDMGEGEKEDVLEERAADQRALGEAGRPVDQQFKDKDATSRAEESLLDGMNSTRGG